MALCLDTFKKGIADVRWLLSARGCSKETRGTAYVVYEDIFDAKAAVDHLSGFNVANRYLIVLYYNPARQTKKVCTSPPDKQIVYE
jgi:pre-mRNA branch site protein p14